ncbi:flagellar hook-associated protein 3 FlgL [Bradyrhizobium japonicum]|jgi:flagellar hook-associated protein 3 FlgL|uniref:flagellin n=1 Tax=Bradyrhizobium TaxID=374 RepID=UPI00037F4FD9|nr:MULTISPECIES: flagellin [Bradyrhizobium]MBP2433741.1 flagellar hook-associated protein 3 FlgL [Bradyrhizobium elkanii]MCP1732872.1 flagellar hook-associated protein 3 FlgL [Bradyrhizobium elkanii]MCP1933544.1 flagellar hook-associated protein 3 FlgL [Bradyrhizobium elkanii]MCS3478447.1 flagellar hook-associated protein 3 FlgL [Bradyrhizobium elkanii]MCS3524311.1 flagellar hook-associated protein 3 FlgL [Bradyrhizobium elkanii]
MMMRVATFAQSDQMISSALRVQAVMANEQVQESSGLQSEDFGGYGSGAGRVINLQVSVTRAQSYIDASQLADNKVQVMYSAVGSVTDIITQLRTQLSAATTGSSTATASVINYAQQAMAQMQGLLDTQYDGEYVFSGARTDTAPADLSSFGTGTGSLTTSDTSYYKGDSEIASVRVSDSQSISYGITADNPAFEQVMRLLKFVGNSSNLSSSDVSQALDLASDALDATSTVQAKLSTAASQIETASTNQSDYQNFAKTLSTDLTSVDVAAVTAQLSTYQAQLTASYSAISKIQSMNLASYLR